MSSRRRAGPDWPRYLDRFHAEHPGVTEDVLGAARHRAQDPYSWLIEPLAAEGPVLDLACGSAPLLSRRAWGGWIGVDRSIAELELARRHGAQPLLRADAAHLPLADRSCRSVMCSMAVMLLQPLDAVLAEIRRILRPGGVAVLLLPGTWPLTARDLARYSRLMLTVRRTHLASPNDRSLLRLTARLRASGLTVTDDRRRRFALPLPDDATTALFVRSLYLPGVPAGRLEAAGKVAAGWAGHDIGLPLRRITVVAR